LHLFTHSINKIKLGAKCHPIAGPAFVQELKSWLHSLCLQPETKEKFTFSVNESKEEFTFSVNELM
jgi:hypothetical protein